MPTFNFLFINFIPYKLYSYSHCLTVYFLLEKDNKMKKVLALISGGKDSCYNAMQCLANGHEIVALGNLFPKGKDDLNSYMYQTVGHHAIDCYAKAMDLPLFKREIQGTSVLIDNDYVPTKLDEVEDLYELLKDAQSKCCFTGVSCGAILSNYQRLRLENVCSRLGLTSFCYLWQRDQNELLQEIFDANVEAIVIKTACLGLNPKDHLGKPLRELHKLLLNLNEKYGINVCGEGGEYETFVLDCPLFKKRIVIPENSIEMNIDNDDKSVGYLNIKNTNLVSKDSRNNSLWKNISYTWESCIKEIDELTTRANIQVEERCIDNVPEKKVLQTNLDKDSLTPLSSFSFADIGIAVISRIIAIKETDLKTSTMKAMNSLKECLQKNNFELKDVICIHLWLSDLSKFVDVNNIYKTFFELKPPARACVEIALPDNVYWQLDCIVSTKGSVANLFVPSISHWAPANIGPYSQANSTEFINCYAGQIPMIPGSLDVIKGGIVKECHLASRNTFKVLKFINEVKPTIVHIFVTKLQDVEIAEKIWTYHYNKYFLKESAGAIGNCHIISCVLSALPKNSLIEYQVLTLKYISESNWKTSSLTSKFNDELELQLLMKTTSNNDDQVVFFDFFISCQKPFQLKGEENKLINQVIKFMDDFKVQLRPIKIFFNANYLLYNQISKELQSHGSIGSFTLIPLNYINSKFGLLHLYTI